MEWSGATEEVELDQTRAKNGSQQSLCHSSHMDTRSRKTEDHVEENSGKRKRTTRMDIMEPSQNASTEQKQLSSSYQFAPAGTKKEGQVKVNKLSSPSCHVIRQITQQTGSAAISASTAIATMSHWLTCNISQNRFPDVSFPLHWCCQYSPHSQQQQNSMMQHCKTGHVATENIHYHVVLLQSCPAVHVRYCIHCMQQLQRNGLCGATWHHHPALHTGTLVQWLVSPDLLHDTRLMDIFHDNQVSLYQNVSVMDSIAAKDDGGSSDIWSHKVCKSPLKSSPPPSQHWTIYRPDALPVTNQQCHSTEGNLLHGGLQFKYYTKQMNISFV